MLKENNIEELIKRVEDGEETGITYNDLVRMFIPDACDDECDYILWEHTVFPFSDIRDVITQLKEYAEGIKCQK